MIQKIKHVLLYLLLFLSFSQIYSQCPKGYFKLESMNYCFPWLTCQDIEFIKLKELIGYGSTKTVYLGEWHNFNISYNILRNYNFRYDFYNGLHNLKALNPSEFVVQLLGFCNYKNIIITEYHVNNNALNFHDISINLSLKEKFKFCFKYAQVISFLHKSPIGVLVNCDSNDLSKLLSQFLITRDLRIIINDLDALPGVKPNLTITCGPKEIKSSFVAPEQRWHSKESFNVKKMKGYNEKTDIWKVPDVCLYFLKNERIDLLQYMLFHIHKLCKNNDPSKRPSADEIVSKYDEIYKLL